MGYFDEIDSKMNSIQEVDEIDKLAGHAFWFSVGSFGVFVYGLVAMLLFWTQFGSISSFLSGDFIAGQVGETIKNSGEVWTFLLAIGVCVVFAFSVALGVCGLVFNIKSHKIAAMTRQKNPLNSMASSFNFLCIVLDIILVSLNVAFIVNVIVPNM